MLLRQARQRGAPDWAIRVLDGDVPEGDVSEVGDFRLLIGHADGGRFEIDVRVFLPARPAVGTDPWRPEGIDVADDELRRLSYIVVDEIVEDTAALSASPWPAIDDRGRLVFPDEPALSVHASVATLVRYFKRTDFRPGDPPEALRMGYAFAARVRRARLGATDSPLLPPSAWLMPPLYDIHSPARDKAKEAFYAAVAPTLSEAEAEAIRKMEPRT